MKYKILKIKNITFESFSSLTLLDKKEILSWRNSDEVSSMMLSDKKISLNTHLSFIEKLENTNDKLYWRIKLNKKKIGVIYLFNITKFNASWGYYLNPTLIGGGYGILLEYLVLIISFEYLKLSELFCETLNANKSVLKIHQYFGYLKLSNNINYTVQKISLKIFLLNKKMYELLTQKFFK